MPSRSACDCVQCSTRLKGKRRPEQQRWLRPLSGSCWSMPLVVLDLGAIAICLTCCRPLHAGWCRRWRRTWDHEAHEMSRAVVYSGGLPAGQQFVLNVSDMINITKSASIVTPESPSEWQALSTDPRSCSHVAPRQILCAEAQTALLFKARSAQRYRIIIFPFRTTRYRSEAWARVRLLDKASPRTKLQGRLAPSIWPRAPFTCTHPACRDLRMKSGDASRNFVNSLKFSGF